MSHTITVTSLPDETTDDVEYTIGGTHDYSCEAWRECIKEWHRHPKNGDDGDEWSTKRVPEVHQMIDGMWMVPMRNRCGFGLSFEYDNPEFQMTRLGVYDVDVEWDGDYWTASLSFRGPAPTGEKQQA